MSRDGEGTPAGVLGDTGAGGPAPAPPAGRWQVFVIGPNDFLRTLGGSVRIFTSLEAAREAAREHGGFVQVAGTAPPGGFDRTFG